MLGWLATLPWGLNAGFCMYHYVFSPGGLWMLRGTVLLTADPTDFHSETNYQASILYLHTVFKALSRASSRSRPNVGSRRNRCNRYRCSCLKSLLCQLFTLGQWTSWEDLRRIQIKTSNR